MPCTSKPSRSTAKKRPHRLGLRHAGRDHLAQDERADPAAGGAGADDDDALLAQRQAGDAHRGQQGPGRDRRRALDVVVEGA
jgi:hypothetical protein